MKRVTIIILAALIAVQISQAGWWKIYGDEDNEVGNCVQLTSDGNYIISGSNGDKPWLLKIDTLGDILWQKVYEVGGSGWLNVFVQETSDGGYILTCGFGLIKTDAQGDTVWTADYGVNAYCVQLVLDDGYIVTGYSGSYPSSRLSLIKTDANGNILWEKSYDVWPRNVNGGHFVKETSDGGYIIVGRTAFDTEEIQESYIWLIKTNGDGDTLWTQEYYSGEYGSGHCVGEASESGYVVIGDSPDGNFWLLKTDSEGDTLWALIYQGLGFNLQATKDGCYIITGATSPSLSYFSPLLADLWLLKINPTGDSIWSRTYGGNNSDYGYFIQQTSDSGYIVAGETWSFGVGGSDLYMLRTDSLGLLAITERSTPERPRDWHIAPSIGSKIVLTYSNHTRGFHALIFDAIGRKVDELYRTAPSGTIAWGDAYPSGVYFIQVLRGNNQINTERIVIVR